MADWQGFTDNPVIGWVGATATAVLGWFGRTAWVARDNARRLSTVEADVQDLKEDEDKNRDAISDLRVLAAETNSEVKGIRDLIEMLIKQHDR